MDVFTIDTSWLQQLALWHFKALGLQKGALNIAITLFQNPIIDCFTVQPHITKLSTFKDHYKMLYHMFTMYTGDSGSMGSAHHSPYSD